MRISEERVFTRGRRQVSSEWWKDVINLGEGEEGSWLVGNSNWEWGEY